MTTFDANTFGPDEVPPEEEGGQSMDVLIDIDGNREDFRIGWYNYQHNKWHYYDQVNSRFRPSMRWSFLPLAIYETNPELRKTVKL